MTIRELQKQAYANVVAKGWPDRRIEVPEQVALICSEACEALKAWRVKQPISWLDSDKKPQGIGAEYANILIRVAHYAELLGVDLEREVIAKLAYNRTRAHRHRRKLG